MILHISDQAQQLSTTGTRGVGGEVGVIPVAREPAALGSTRLALTGEEQAVHEQFLHCIKSKHIFLLY